VAIAQSAREAAPYTHGRQVIERLMKRVGATRRLPGNPELRQRGMYRADEAVRMIERWLTGSRRSPRESIDAASEPNQAPLRNDLAQRAQDLASPAQIGELPGQKYVVAAGCNATFDFGLQ